jgi:hypothetical protein
MVRFQPGNGKEKLELYRIGLLGLLWEIFGFLKMENSKWKMENVGLR